MTWKHSHSVLPTNADPKLARSILKKVARRIDAVATAPEWQREHAYLRVKEELDGFILDYFRLSPSERVLVRDTVKYVAASIQPSDYMHLSTPLLHRPQKPEIKEYVDVLAQELADWRGQDRGKGTLSVRAFTDGDRGFFGAVEVRVNRTRKDTTEVIDSAGAFERILADLENAIAGRMISLKFQTSC
ncbi:hypothetical protein [Rhizobium gallicum]|uniref:hypothetical protein n=1 Tax=Rhizobium gallicum TaxID=56730 RepID=UPI001EF7F3ED|nr:hypothetical protein [Rhizobium gallicum]ULJ74476.1 hypothetical protein L2W42_21765 [Rhizobium gallicum]